MTYTSPWMNAELEGFRDAARRFIAAEILPHQDKWKQQQHVDRDIWTKTGEMGMLLADIPEEYGGGGLDYISYGLMMQELERGDSGVRSTASVQGSLVMFPIYEYGSEEQRRKYLPKLASGEWLGSWGLTEPGSGSDAGGARTTAVKRGDKWVLNG